MTLISKLQTIKEHLAFQRLFVTHARENSEYSYSAKNVERELGRIALIESEVILLQHRLSFLCSVLRACLDEWEDIDARQEIQKTLSTLIQRLSFSRSKLARVSTVFKRRPERTFEPLMIHRATIEKYLGFKMCHTRPEVTAGQIDRAFLMIRNTNILDAHSIESTIREIGKEEALYWNLYLSFKDKPGPNFFRDRMN